VFFREDALTKEELDKKLAEAEARKHTQVCKANIIIDSKATVIKFKAY
jgi:hypothetical protein